MLDGTDDRFSRNTFAPIAIHEEAMDHIQIKSAPVGADQKTASATLIICESDKGSHRVDAALLE
jgi:hypothetical protein